jgi:two-component system alkaline phosphatase synthesis response regulator PhoP
MAMALNRRILVVDDEPFILRSLTFVLRKEGFEVLEAQNGEEALDVIRAERPALVVLDVMMPKKNGYEVLAEVKNDDELKSTHVIMLTARGQEADRMKGIALGVNEYMTKPFSPLKIVERAREVLGQVVQPAT